jgi:hypothetical protein
MFNRLPTEGYTQGGKFWVRGRRDQKLEGAKNTRLYTGSGRTERNTLRPVWWF